MLAEDVMDVDYVAWQADHDAYGFSGQKLGSTLSHLGGHVPAFKTWRVLVRKCSAQSMLFMHEILGMTWPRYESVTAMWRFPYMGVPVHHPIFMGFSLINPPFWGTSIDGNLQLSPLIQLQR